MRSSVVFLAILLMGCSSEDFEKKFQYTLDRAEGPGGTVFELQVGDLRCAAGFVYAIQARVYTNQNDLEFWCRKGPADIEFDAIGRPARQFKTKIANLDNRLFEFGSQQTYDFDKERWEPNGWPSRFTAQRVNGMLYSVSRDDRCAGMSVYVDGQYRGTINVDGWQQYSAIHISGENVIANLDNKVWVGAIPGSESKTCRFIPVERVVADGWIYGFYPFKERIVFGGSSPGYGGNRSGCAPFFSMGADVTEIAPLLGGEACAGGQIKEYYSYTPSGDGVLVGNFPLGTLLKLNDEGFSSTTLAKPQADDWLDPVGTRYRESQSLVVAYGNIFVGMYPWSELFAIEGEFQQVIRLIDEPEKDSSPAPYFWELFRQARDLPGVVFDSKQELVYSLTYKDGRTLRADGYEPTLWGQRIPTIAVFNGRLCASTGNLDGGRYDPEKHAVVPETVAEQSGTVHCGKLANHTLANNLPLEGSLTLAVTDERIVIFVNGEVVAENGHDLPSDDIAKLNRAAIKIGSGDYGPFKGRIKLQ